MVRLGMAAAFLAWAMTTGPALADAAAFQALSPDAQLIVNRVTDDKPSDKAICAASRDELRSSLTKATKGLYFGGILEGDPREAGTAAGAYIKALCQR